MDEKTNIKSIIKNTKELITLLQEAKKIISELSGGNGLEPKETVPSILTPKEKEVFGLFKKGLSVKQISSKLDMAYKTVGVHRTNMIKKLNLKSAKEFYDLARR